MQDLRAGSKNLWEAQKALCEVGSNGWIWMTGSKICLQVDNVLRNEREKMIHVHTV